VSSFYNHRWRVIVDPIGQHHPHFIEDKIPFGWKFIDSESLSRSESLRMVYELNQVRGVMES
jgi:hypothetical protein